MIPSIFSLSVLEFFDSVIFVADMRVYNLGRRITVVKGEDQSKRIANMIAVFAIGAVLIPFLVLGNDYLFKVHDYMDYYLGWMHILRFLPLVPSFDASVGIMGDMPAYFPFPEFNAYRLLNYYFDFVFAEFLNRAFSVGIGFLAMKYLLQTIFPADRLTQALIILIPTAYAVSIVYPAWSLGFSILPWIMAKIFRYWHYPSEKISWHMLFFFLVPLFFHFAHVGLFVCLFLFLTIFAYWVHFNTVNRPMVIALIFMSIGFCVTNTYLFMMAFSGVETNRLLMHPQEGASIGVLIYQIFREFRLSLIHGQYHAKMIFQIIAPICGIGGIWCYLLYWRNQLATEEVLLGRRLFKLFIIICAIAMVYALDDVGIIRKVFSYGMPILVGFNFGRLIYLNNVFWYILFAGILSILLTQYKKESIITGIALIHLIVALFSGGQTRYNFFRYCYEKHMPEMNSYVTYHEFVDKDFWNRLKEKIRYNDEKVICVGFHPSVAITNDFKTMDGYLPVHPMSYHKQFRDIIAPSLDKYKSLQNYYDTWGGRMYVYTDNTKDSDDVDKSKTVKEKVLLIDPEVFKRQGGKYILSRYVLANAEDLHLKMICDYDELHSLYHIFVYQVL